MPRGVDSSLGRLLIATRGHTLPPGVCSTSGTHRKDWNPAGSGERGSWIRGEDEATTQTVVAVVRAKAEGL